MKRTCTSVYLKKPKLCFTDLAEAYKWLYERHSYDPAYQVYDCPNCDYLHIGRRPTTTLGRKKYGRYKRKGDDTPDGRYAGLVIKAIREDLTNVVHPQERKI
jgi:hypothetical protein